MLPVLPVSNSNSQLALNIGIGNISTLATFFIGVCFSTCAFAEPAYTNHAGNVVSGVVVALDARTAATSLTTHESVARNKVIAKALDWAGYVERSGHGTEFIIEKCEAQGLATPQYKPDSAIFHTIIWRKTTESAVNKARLTPRTGGVVDGVEAQSGTSHGWSREHGRVCSGPVK